jgi:hypothetical protein
VAGLAFLRRIAEARGGAATDLSHLGLPSRWAAAFFTMTPGVTHDDPIGTGHGGVASTRLDTA